MGLFGSSTKRSHDAAAAITAGGGGALAPRCDVSRIEDVELLAKGAQTWFGGPPTVVINNAGVGAGGLPIGEMSLDDWQWVLGINLWGPIHGCHVFAPILREAGMAIDMDAMLAKIKDRQWALADIDWDAPGAETITDE